MMSTQVEWVEQVVYFDGDAAQEAFDILYPDSRGFTAQTAQATVEHLKGWDHGEPTDEGVRAHQSAAREFRHEGYLVQWDYAYGWISLQRIMVHADYPHEPGRLYDCALCEARCWCTEGHTECVFSGEHNPT